MKKIISILVFTLASSALVIAGGKNEGLSGEYNLGGSTTVAPIMTYAIEEFSEIEPGVRISYEAVGSSTGIKGVINDIYLIGGASREVKSSELESGIIPVPIALDCLVMIVNSDVSIENITKEQLAQIFTGRISNWKEVGGENKEINVVTREESSGTFGTFKDMIIKPAYGKKEKIKSDSIVVSSNGDMITKVASTPSSIGYTGLGYVDQLENAGGKVIMLNSVVPGDKTVKDGSYGLSRKLYLTYKGEIEEGSFKEIFIDFILGETGQSLVEESGFIPLN